MTNYRQALSIAQNIAAQLNEKHPAAIFQIQRIVGVIGEDRARNLLRETLTIEAKGGMPTAKGDRRRSPGGVYLYLSKQRLSPGEKKAVWTRRKKKKKPEG